MKMSEHEQARYGLHIGPEYLSVEQRAALHKHLMECVECRTYSSELARLRIGLSRTMQARWDRYRPAAGMAQRVQHIVSARSIQRRALGWANALATAGIAIALVIFAIWFLSISSPASITPTPQSASAPEITPDTTLEIQDQITRVKPTPFPGLAVFDDRITLSQSDVPNGVVLAGSTISVTLRWQTVTAIETSYTVFLDILDATGNLVAQSDAIPGDGARPTTSWQPGDVIEDQHQLVLPDDLASGSYQLVGGLYDPQTTERLFTNDGMDAAQLGAIEVQGIAQRIDEEFADIATVLGFDLTSESVAAGGSTELTLYWRASNQKDSAYLVSLQVFDSDKLIVSQVERALPTNTWQRGDVIAETYRIEMPESASAGSYNVLLLVFDAVHGTQIFTGSGNGAVAVTTLSVATPESTIAP